MAVQLFITVVLLAFARAEESYQSASDPAHKSEENVCVDSLRFTVKTNNIQLSAGRSSCLLLELRRQRR